MRAESVRFNTGWGFFHPRTGRVRATGQGADGVALTGWLALARMPGAWGFLASATGCDALVADGVGPGTGGPVRRW
jgi:hypothetical protein